MSTRSAEQAPCRIDPRRVREQRDPHAEDVAVGLRRDDRVHLDVEDLRMALDEDGEATRREAGSSRESKKKHSSHESKSRLMVSSYYTRPADARGSVSTRNSHTELSALPSRMFAAVRPGRHRL